MEIKKQLLVNEASDMIGNLLHWNRENYKDLSLNDVDELIENKEITKEDIKQHFGKALDKFFKDRYKS